MLMHDANRRGECRLRSAPSAARSASPGRPAPPPCSRAAVYAPAPRARRRAREPRGGGAAAEGKALVGNVIRVIPREASLAQNKLGREDCPGPIPPFPLRSFGATKNATHDVCPVGGLVGRSGCCPENAARLQCPGEAVGRMGPSVETGDLWRPNCPRIQPLLLRLSSH